MVKESPSKTTNDKLHKMRTEAEIETSLQDNRSRSRIAYGFTFAFIAFIGVILIGGPIYNAIVSEDKLLDVSDILSSFIGQFGAPLGFVLGYYFKDKNS